MADFDQKGKRKCNFEQSPLTSRLLALFLLFACSQSQAQIPNASESKNYSAFARANNFYGPGIVYGVDADKNSYVLADLTKEAEIPVEHSAGAPLFASSEVELKTDLFGTLLPYRPSFRGLIDGGFRDDLSDRIISLVAKQLWKEKRESLKSVELQMDDVRIDWVRPLDVDKVLIQTDFAKRRAHRAARLHMYLVSETISIGAFKIRFKNVSADTLAKAVGHLPADRLPGALISSDTIEAKPESRLVIAFRAISIDEMFHRKISNRFRGDRYSSQPANDTFPSLSLSPFTPLRIRTVPASNQEVKHIPVPKGIPLAFTHFVETANLVSYAKGAHYGELFSKLQHVLVEVAGFNEIRVYDSGTGFAIATLLEVTQDDGQPLRGPQRFLPLTKGKDFSRKRLRGFYITASAHPEPTAIVSTSKPQDLFSMDYGLPYLPDDMASVPTDSETTVRVFVVEFRRTQTGNLVRLRSSECANSGISHLLQAGILK